MTKEDAIRIIRKMLACTDLSVRANLNADMVDACHLAIKALEQEPRWIPVSERLPQESLNSIIGWDDYRKRCVLVQYIDGHFQITGKAESFDIKAWMPLPTEYEGVEK